MKNVIFSILLATIGLTVFGQEYDKLLLLYSTQKFEDAKKELDKVSADPKAHDKAETYLWKLKVNAELFADSTLRNKYPDAAKEAMDALNNYAAKEPDLKMMKESGMRAVSVMYGQSFNAGRDYFKEKDWNKAFESLARCQQVSEFIGKNGLNTNGKYTIDTVVVLYTAYAAQNAGKQDDAAQRYKSLADWKVKDTEYVDIYKFILDYDTRKKDEASFKKYLALAKELYPNDAAIWNQFEMNYMGANASLTDIMAKYKADDAAGKLKENDYITYAETFASPDKSQVSQLDSAKQNDLKMTAADAFTKAFNLNNTNGLYAFNAGVLYYSVFGQLDDQYYNLRGESAELKKQRDDVVKQQQDMATKAIEWLEKGYTLLKAKTTREKSESSSLNRSVDYLANLYLWKRDKSRGSNPKEYDAYDAKYKLYDSEHDKYKM